MLGKIADIKKALDHEAYQAALALALTLPDICSVCSTTLEVLKTKT